MKNKIAALSLLALGLFGGSTAFAQNIDKVDTSIFPKPEKGYVQYVIEVPHSTIEEDNNKKIEIYVGKYTQVDKCNTFRLSGEFKKEDLKGWGYNYYTFKTNGNIMATQMGCLDNSSVSKFVSAGPFDSNYNGRMPIVIYVPEGYDVQYKIFKAEPETYKAMQVRQKSK